MATKVCLVLTEETIEKNLALLDEYKGYYDIAELRVDLLFSNETFYIRSFPELAKVPVILTCRRIVDGGKFKDGEGARMTVLAKALAFLDADRTKNFAYVDFESDFNSSTLEEAARAFDIKIIRSLHNLKVPISQITKATEKIRRTDDEIVKLATVVPTLKDLTALFLQSPNSKSPYIISGLGKYGYLSRIFAQKIGSEIVYTFSKRYISKNKLQNECIDPISLHEIYGFNHTSENPKMYAVVGTDVQKSKSPEIHNKGFQKWNLPACYVPISVENFSLAFTFAKKLNIQGLSITSPFKAEAFSFANMTNKVPEQLHVINTLVNKNSSWVGYNTDVLGFKKALQEFLTNEELSTHAIAIIGAGGVAESVCVALHELLSLPSNTPNNKNKNEYKVCIFNRTKTKAEQLAKKYNFDFCPLFSPDVHTRLVEFSNLIINCTTVGSIADPKSDPIPFYHFSGHEKVFDVIYEPEKTKLLQRAKKAGCKIENGYKMLYYQAIEQFKLFTGKEYGVL